jgi:hypothetical protein
MAETVSDLFDRIFALKGHWSTIDLLDRHCDKRGSVAAPCEEGNVPLATMHWWQFGDFVAVTSDLRVRPFWHDGTLGDVLALYQ